MTHHRAKRPLRAVAVLAIGLGAAALPGVAHAQFFGGWGGWDNGGGGWDGGLAPQEARRAIAGRGFRVLAPLRRNGNVYVADVIGPRGQHERLIVAVADAQILQRFLVDDGRDAPGAFPRRADDGVGDERGPVPPADIPNIGRRFARPVDRDPPSQRFGDVEPNDPAVVPLSPDAPVRREQPAIRTVKPRPRVVERTPEIPSPGREPGPVEATPLAPAAPRPPVAPVPAPIAKAPAAAAPAAVASRPEPAPATVPASVPAQPAAAAPRRMTDPLAITGGGEVKPVRNVATGITGTPAPAPAPAPAAKPADVPAAPLD